VRTATIAVAAAVTTGASALVATPAYAAPSANLQCEWHLDFYYCHVEPSGYDSVDIVTWIVRGIVRDEHRDRLWISRACARHGQAETIRVGVIGFRNGQVVGDVEDKLIPCNCLPGN
jgi:hypothetical protein